MHMFRWLFNKPNIDRLIASNDFDSLLRLLSEKNVSEEQIKKIVSGLAQLVTMSQGNSIGEVQENEKARFDALVCNDSKYITDVMFELLKQHMNWAELDRIVTYLIDHDQTTELYTRFSGDQLEKRNRSGILKNFRFIDAVAGDSLLPGLIAQSSTHFNTEERAYFFDNILLLPTIELMSPMVRLRSTYTGQPQMIKLALERLNNEDDKWRGSYIVEQIFLDGKSFFKDKYIIKVLIEKCSENELLECLKKVHSYYSMYLLSSALLSIGTKQSLKELQSISESIDEMGASRDEGKRAKSALNSVIEHIEKNEKSD
jgi:hypothetical protein